ncbi:MAG: VOC family protein [Nitrososphaerales archaeon]
MSLIGQLPLAAIWLYCKNIDESKHFYKDVVGLKLIDEEDGTLHFDLGNIRLSLLPKPEVKGQKTETKITPSDHLVFLVESSIEAVQDDLVKRGAKMRTKKIIEDSLGKTTWFSDPDGHLIYLWQPPRRGSKNFKGVESIVKHYESVSRALADLREVDE